MTPGTTTFGTLRTGQTVHRVTIGNGDLSASVLTLGAILQDVRLTGVAHALTVGCPQLGAYEGRMAHCGAIMGPVVNRIANARAVFEGRTYRLEANQNGKHTLHSGSHGAHSQIWQITDKGPTFVCLSLDLDDGAQGLPGSRSLSARFDADDGNRLRLTLTATTDAPTLMNLANHSYWRMDDGPNTRGQTLRIAAEHYLPATADLLPTGQIAPVAGTRFDYRQGRRLQGGAEGLIDNNFCLSRARQPLRPVAWLTGTSGLTLELATTEPGLQVFDGHILGAMRAPGNDGAPYTAHAGLALEAQFWPDAPNHADFPPILLHPAEDWRHVTTWAFSQPA